MSNKLPTPTTEIVIGSILLALLVIIFNPFAMYMTPMTSVMIALVFMVLFGFFSLFALREQPQDEREELVRYKTSRNAFLITGAVLTAGIAVQVIQHTVDPWLLIVFAVMIFAKLFGYIHQNRKN